MERKVSGGGYTQRKLLVISRQNGKNRQKCTPLFKFFQIFQGIISTQQNARNYNNYNYNKMCYTSQNRANKKKGVTLCDTLLVQIMETLSRVKLHYFIIFLILKVGRGKTFGIWCACVSNLNLYNQKDIHFLFPLYIGGKLHRIIILCII